MTCYGGMCNKCRGGMWAVLGLLVLANAYWSVLGWAWFVGRALVLKGVMKLVKPNCGHC